MAMLRNNSFILLVCISVLSGARSQSLPYHSVVYNDRCVWTGHGGNLTTAEELCNENGGNIFTFKNMSDASAILDKLDIPNDTPVYIRTSRLHGNSSAYLDWQSQPGTWPLDGSANITSENWLYENVCTELLNGALSLTNCTNILNVTVCENDDLQECLGREDSFDPITNSVTTGPNDVTATPDTYPVTTYSNPVTTDYKPVTLGPDPTMIKRALSPKPSTNTTKVKSSVKQTTVTKEPCNNTSCTSARSETSTPSPTSVNSSDLKGHASYRQTTKPTKVDLGELMIVPDGNGTRITNFSSLLSEIFQKSNFSKEIQATTAPPTTLAVTKSNTSNNCTRKQDRNLTCGTPVREAKFQTANNDKIFHGRVQVSGIHSGSVLPYSPLLIDSYSHEIEELENISRVLNTLKQEQQVDNNTMMVFAETVGAATGDGQITAETEQLKKDLFSDIMCVGEDLVKKFPASTKEMSLTTDKIVLHSRVIKPPADSASSVFIEVDHPHTDTHIRLAKSIFDTEEESDQTRVSTIAYKKMGSFVKASNKYLTSTVVSVTVQVIKGNETKHSPIKKKDAILFVMETYIQTGKIEKKRLCSFWDFSERKWSTSGCSVISKNTTHTNCKCNHLTNFAILVMYVETENISLESQQALFTLTTVGCSLSIACLAMTLICYIYLQMLTNEKIMIHANLCVALLLGQIVFVASGDAHRDAMACKVVAILLHFLFMGSFTWMMVEGIALYLCCTKGIFHHRDMRVKYFLFGWGLPLIIVVISLAARFPDYGSGPQYSCWLSIDDGLIWAFLGPMLVIVVLNIGVMGLVIKCFLTLRANSEKTEAARLKGSLRAMMTLLPLLGVTWILSLLVPFSVVFHYFFVIFNTVQGMCIFFLHCICNEEIRKKFYEKRRRWSTTRTGSDAEMTFPSRRKTGSFDAIRIAATSTPLPAEYASRTVWS